MSHSKKRIELLPLRELIPHEDVVSDRLAILLRDLASRKIIEKPVIVDEKTHVIIDGHHRYNALRILGVRFIPVVLANYNRDISEIRSFTKKLIVAGRDEASVLLRVEEILREHGKKYDEPTIIRIGSKQLVLHVDPVDLSLTLKEYNNLNQLKDSSGRLYVVTIMPPPLKPYHVVKVVGEGLTLSPRTTKHVTWLKKYYFPVKISKLY